MSANVCGSASGVAGTEARPADVLLALADRCEREEPSRELDAEIAVACDVRAGWLVGYGPLWIDHATIKTIGQPTIRVNNLAPSKPSTGNPPAGDYLPFTTSLDAAVTLVPEATYGGKKGLMTMRVDQTDDGSFYAELRDGWQTSYGGVHISHAKTESMARCAAALRARAALTKAGV